MSKDTGFSRKTDIRSAMPEPTEKTPILSVKNLTQRFGDNIVFENVSFDVCRGEVLVIVGSSGCGKSTLLGLLAGITRPDKGKIMLRGEDITGKSGMLGYMPQEDLLFPWLNVLENALIPVRVRNGDLKTALGKLHQLLPVFGLQDHAKHLPYQLSGGLRQRTALLRTCMMETPLLLLDDIFDKLDDSRVLQLIVLVNQEHFGQIFITDTHKERTENVVKRINEESKIFELS